MKTKWLYSYDGDNNDGNINDGDTFAWTSNIQLISKVYLKKHTSMGCTYTLNKKDYKMVRVFEMVLERWSRVF